MPTYQYACTECRHAFEQFQSFTDDALTECPQCQGRLRKLFNAVGVVFKGSGFYRNDSRAATESSSGSDGATSEKTGSEKTGSDGSGSATGSSTEKAAPATSSSGSGSGSSGSSTATAGSGS